MKKKLLFRCLLGAPLGLAISHLITVAISLCVGDGSFYPVVPELAAACGSELNAVVAQTAFSLLYGAAWGGASVIWEVPGWSLLRMTVTHLAVCSVFTFPIAYAMRWMPHGVMGVLGYFAIFFAIYLAIWLAQYFSTKKKVKEMNRKLEKM